MPAMIAKKVFFERAKSNIIKYDKSFKGFNNDFFLYISKKFPFMANTSSSANYFIKDIIEHRSLLNKKSTFGRARIFLYNKAINKKIEELKSIIKKVNKSDSISSFSKNIDSLLKLWNEMIDIREAYRHNILMVFLLFLFILFIVMLFLIVKNTEKNLLMIIFLITTLCLIIFSDFWFLNLSYYKFYLMGADKMENLYKYSHNFSSNMSFSKYIADKNKQDFKDFVDFKNIFDNINGSIVKYKYNSKTYFMILDSKLFSSCRLISVYCKLIENTKKKTEILNGFHNIYVSLSDFLREGNRCNSIYILLLFFSQLLIVYLFYKSFNKKE